MNYTICLPFKADFLELIDPAQLGRGGGGVDSRAAYAKPRLGGIAVAKRIPLHSPDCIRGYSCSTASRFLFMCRQHSAVPEAGWDRIDRIFSSVEEEDRISMISQDGQDFVSSVDCSDRMNRISQDQQDFVSSVDCLDRINRISQDQQDFVSSVDCSDRINRISQD
jgi:hypothetical protein